MGKSKTARKKPSVTIWKTNPPSKSGAEGIRT